MRLKQAITAGVLLVMAGCGQVVPTEEEVPVIRQIVEATNEEMAACFSEGDAGCLAGFFAADGWLMRSNVPVLAGQQAIQRHWQQTLPGGTWEVFFETRTVEESGPLAVERGKYTMTFTVDPAAQTMRPSFTERGTYVTQWRLDTTGRWFIVAQALVAEITGRTAQG
ncbi:MAG: DUF4440 domain-containing protein [Acidobacteriota bacterium]